MATIAERRDREAVPSRSGRRRIPVRLEPDQPLGPIFGRCLVVLTVTVLVVARRVLAHQVLLRDDRRPNPDGRLLLLDEAVEFLLPRPVARYPGCPGTLALDEERVPIRVVVEETLNVDPLLEIRASLRVVDAGDWIGSGFCWIPDSRLRLFGQTKIWSIRSGGSSASISSACQKLLPAFTTIRCSGSVTSSLPWRSSWGITPSGTHEMISSFLCWCSRIRVLDVSYVI